MVDSGNSRTTSERQEQSQQKRLSGTSSGQNTSKCRLHPRGQAPRHSPCFLCRHSAHTERESTNNELNEAVSLERLAKRSWETVETPEAKLVTDGDDVLTGDPSRLQQLFENLYRNTIDHSSGQVTVTVGELADGFYVEDTGPGIPENEREKIFTPGYSTDADNTGLGLAIVQNVAQTHGFEVVVTQANSGGVRFEFKNT
ncbi:HAMP domain-containing sensor histidine kinase [Halorubrum sp. RMP-47]|uniref:sensor histidine kinase n=1 Tax=Halorubrum miltondacostae TaxID=3076378 RepID=UPI003528CF42